MDIPDWYQTVAEIAIGLAGFSGLAVALRRDVGPLSEIQKFRMGVLFGMTFGALFLALLPGLLFDFGVANSMLWPLASAIMIVWSLLFMYLWLSRSRRVARSAPEIFNWLALSIMTTGHVLNLVLQFGFLFAWFGFEPQGVFGAGLIWYLTHGAQQFVRMLFIQPREEHEQ